MHQRIIPSNDLFKEGKKPSPRIVYRFGNQKGQIMSFLKFRSSSKHPPKSHHQKKRLEGLLRLSKDLWRLRMNSQPLIPRVHISLLGPFSPSIRSHKKGRIWIFLDLVYFLLRRTKATAITATAATIAAWTLTYNSPKCLGLGLKLSS